MKIAMDQTGMGEVECVAPLLRGLKRARGLLLLAVFDSLSRMRCPAIEGIETKKGLGPLEVSYNESNALPRY